MVIDKYLCIDDETHDLFCDECGMSEEAAKRCALIAVGECLFFHENLYITEGSSAYQCFQSVKQEIQKL